MTCAAAIGSVARVVHMAKRTSTIVVDDLTGDELGANAVTVTFALEGAGYEIDLAPAAAAELREALAPFVGAARKVGRSNSPRRGSASTAAPTGEQSAAHTWLVQRGIDVPSRGRLSAELLQRYRTR